MFHNVAGLVLCLSSFLSEQEWGMLFREFENVWDFSNQKYATEEAD